MHEEYNYVTNIQQRGLIAPASCWQPAESLKRGYGLLQLCYCGQDWWRMSQNMRDSEIIGKGMNEEQWIWWIWWCQLKSRVEKQVGGAMEEGKNGVE